jgi:hypothetical protein
VASLNASSKPFGTGFEELKVTPAGEGAKKESSGSAGYRTCPSPVTTHL